MRSDCRSLIALGSVSFTSISIIVQGTTQRQLIKVQNDMLLAMDRQHVTFLVLLDLSAAFDTLDHEALLRRFEVTYGITGTAPQWFRSYLTGKSQRVYINHTYSDVCR